MRRGRKTQVRLRMKPKKARWKTLKMKITSEAGSEVSRGNESTEQETEIPCPSCQNNMAITSLQTCPHCKWKDTVKGSVFVNKALVFDICQHNFPANSRSVRETIHRCNRCSFISHW